MRETGCVGLSAPFQIVHQLEEPACWLAAGGTGQEQPSAGRSLLLLDLRAGGLVLLGASAPAQQRT